MYITFQQSMMKCMKQWENPVQKHFSVQFHPFTCKVYTFWCSQYRVYKRVSWKWAYFIWNTSAEVKEVRITLIHNRMQILKQNSSILLCHIPECCFLEPSSICETRTQTENLQQEVICILRSNTTLPHRSTITSIQFPGMS